MKSLICSKSYHSVWFQTHKKSFIISADLGSAQPFTSGWMRHSYSGRLNTFWSRPFPGRDSVSKHLLLMTAYTSSSCFKTRGLMPSFCPCQVLDLVTVRVLVISWQVCLCWGFLWAGSLGFGWCYINRVCHLSWAQSWNQISHTSLPNSDELCCLLSAENLQNNI